MHKNVATNDALQHHIVDVLIAERAPHLSHSFIWPALRAILYAVLNYDKARRMADTIAPLRGDAALQIVSTLLRLQLDIVGVERTPRHGAFLALVNHPTGITDGIAIYDALKPIRPDVMFYANADAHRVCAGFMDNLIPVEWVLEKRSRERTRLTLKMTEQAVHAGRPIVIFPAGRLARRQNGVVTDPEWMATAASLARKYELPMLPIHVRGPYAFWFHSFGAVSKELRDMTLFHELLNKQGKTYTLTFGPLIPASSASGDPASAMRRIKYYVERVLPVRPNAPFDPAGPECPYSRPADAA